MIPSRKFWFNGQCSADFGIVASGSGTFDAPERDVSYISIGGRNGDLVIDNGRFKNKPIKYPVFIHEAFGVNAPRVREWLLSSKGYGKLQDEYNPDTYRMAVFTGPIDFDMQFLNRIGEATLRFYCKPQRFLVDGDIPVAFSAAGSLYNPTTQIARPFITIYGAGAGELTVGGITVKIKELKDQIILDCELQDAYRQVGDGAPENKNSCIYAPEFPVLVPGKNTINWTGDITSVEIIPRWWTL